MMPGASGTWPQWSLRSDATTGPQDLRPTLSRPVGRTAPLRVVVPTTTGTTKRASPPPDLARVASSVALLGALLVALMLQWLLC